MSDHGYWWVERFEGSKPEIAYRSKGGDWTWLGMYEQWTKMVKKVGYTHPNKVFYKVENFDIGMYEQLTIESINR